MTFAEREQIAAATENCRKLAEAVAALTKRVNDLEDAAGRLSLVVLGRQPKPQPSRSAARG